MREFDSRRGLTKFIFPLSFLYQDFISALLVLNDEQKKKISVAKKGKPRDPETKKKMWAAIQNWRTNATPNQIAAREIKRITNLRAVSKRDPITGRYLKNENK